MIRSETYASFSHPSRNPISFDALFTAPALPLSLEAQVRIDRVVSGSQALLDQAKQLLNDLDQPANRQR